MSSSDRDGSATADETVPPMNDTTIEELLYYKTHMYSFWLYNFLEIKAGMDTYDDIGVYCWRSFFLFPGIVSLHAWSICTNCCSVGIGAGYKLFLHRNATNHHRDHSSSIRSTRLCVCGHGS